MDCGCINTQFEICASFVDAQVDGRLRTFDVIVLFVFIIYFVIVSRGGRDPKIVL